MATTGLLHNFLRDLNRLYQTHGMYPRGHEQVSTAARLAAASLEEWGQPVRMSFVGDDLLVEDQSVLTFGERLKGLTAAFRTAGWDGVRIEPGCSPTDLLDWVDRCREGQKAPYARGGIRAGSLDAGGDGPGGAGQGQWSGQHGDYVLDVQKAMKQVAAANPEGLELAKNVVRNVFSGMDRNGELLNVARALKSYDEYTFTHVLNVSIVSMGMAKRLGLAGELVRVIALGGLFHDVGKERLPIEVLNKPGRLTAEEREIMNRHPPEGADILLSLHGDVDSLLPTIAYQHHMGSDLGGYPTSRWGVPAHPASRLVAVADVFDALRTIRPYRGALTEVQACNILLQDLRRGALDGACVAALLGLLELLAVGQRVDLEGGVSGTIIAPGEGDSLRALVETEEGEIVDLSDPAAPPIVALREEQERTGAVG